MAGFCSKCGASLASSTTFCSSCGAPIGSEVATPVAAAAPAVSPQAAANAVPPPAAYPAAAAYPPPKSSGGGALKIVLIVVAVIVCIGVIGAGIVGYGIWRVAHTVHVNDDGKGVTLSVPGAGTISAGDSSASDADLGVPAYPGADREKGGMELNSSSASMVMAHFTTGDSVSQVVDFYKGKMGDSAVSISTGNGTVLSSGANDQDKVTVTVAPGSGDEAGKTAIVVMHTKKSQ